MKQIVVALSIATALSGGFLAQSVTHARSLEQERNALAIKIAALRTERDGLKKRVLAATPQQIRQEFVVPGGSVQPYTFTASGPGTLVGRWRSSGKGTGALDDTIQQFRLTDPSDRMLESSAVKASAGQFVVHLSERGGYTFFFDNAGLFRANARRVFLEAEFRAD
jgi:hypothetical protein